MEENNPKTTSGSDRALEGLLRRTLAHTPPAATECPTAETMAAYFERSLEPDERERVEIHLASCADCREMLAAMDCAASATNDAPIGRAQSNWAWLWDWRWLAPATAVLALAGIWFVKQRGEARMAETSTQLPLIVESRPLETLPAPMAPPVEPAPKAAVPQAQLSATISGGIARQKEETPAAKKSAATDMEEKRKQPAQNALREMEADQLKQNPAQTTNGASARALQSVAPQAAAPPPPIGSGGAPESVAGAGAAPTAPQYQPEQPRAESNATPRRMSAPMIAARAAPTLQISSPDPKALWRVNGNGTVEHSTDGGATWQPQQVKAGMEILSASAPTAMVCWLAGRAGVVLLTTDGTTWSTVSVPVKADIATITAQDAFNATVQTTDGRKFSTTDAGKTWISQP